MKSFSCDHATLVEEQNEKIETLDLQYCTEGKSKRQSIVVTHFLFMSLDAVSYHYLVIIEQIR